MNAVRPRLSASTPTAGQPNTVRSDEGRWELPGELAGEVARLRRRGTAKWGSAPSGVLAAWVAEMDYPTAHPVRRAVRDLVEADTFGYPRDDAETGLPEAFAAFAARRWDWPVPPHRVVLVPDVVTGIVRALEVFTPAGAPVVVPTPAYPRFFQLLEYTRRPAAVVPSRYRGGLAVLDLDRIDAELAAGARAVLLTNPHNPLGRVWRRAELTALAGVVERHGARVVADEVHAPLVLPGHRHVPYARTCAAAAAHSVTVTSASKGWNISGLRCAHLVLHDERSVRLWQRLPQVAREGAAGPGIAASLAAYRQGEPWLDDVLARLERARRLLSALVEDLLPAVRMHPVQGTYLAWLDMRALDLPPSNPAASGRPDLAGFFLRRAGVLLSDGRAFGAAGEGFLRLNFAASPRMLTEIVHRMAAALPG